MKFNQFVKTYFQLDHSEKKAFHLIIEYFNSEEHKERLKMEKYKEDFIRSHNKRLEKKRSK